MAGVAGLAALAAGSEARAGNQYVPLNSVPLGRGAGASDFNSLTPTAWFFDTLIDAIAAMIPSGINAIHTAGYSSAGDNGGALYNRVSSQPSFPGYFQSADGSYWQIASDILAPEMFGAVNPALDSYPAIANLVLTATALNIFDVQLRSRIYLLSATVDLLNIRVRGAGVQWQSTPPNQATIIRAATANMLMIKNGVMSDIVIDGNGIALWGWLIGGLPRQPSNTVEVINCTEYGVVLNQLQNSVFYNLNPRLNKYNLVLANGARNNNFYNFTSSCEGGMIGAHVDQRCILFLIDTSNPHGFGLSTNVTELGNDRNSWFGGISENIAGGSGQYMVETQNRFGFVGITADQVNFFSYEFDGISIFLFDSTWTGTISCYNCAFGMSADAPFSSGAYGTINFFGTQYFSGNNSLPCFGVSSANNFETTLTYHLIEYVKPPYSLSGNLGTVSFNERTRSFSVTDGPGGGIGGLSVGNIGHTNFITTRQPIIHVTFSVRDVVGGSGNIKVYADLAAPPWRKLIGAYGSGIHDVYYQTTSVESGSISFTYGDVTSFTINGIRIEYI